MHQWRDQWPAMLAESPSRYCSDWHTPTSNIPQLLRLCQSIDQQQNLGMDCLALLGMDCLALRFPGLAMTTRHVHGKLQAAVGHVPQQRGLRTAPCNQLQRVAAAPSLQRCHENRALRADHSLHYCTQALSTTCLLSLLHLGLVSKMTQWHQSESTLGTQELGLLVDHNLVAPFKPQNDQFWDG